MSAGLGGQPVVPVLVEVQGVDDAQGTIAGGQLAGRQAGRGNMKHSTTDMQLSTCVSIFARAHLSQVHQAPR